MQIILKKKEKENVDIKWKQTQAVNLEWNSLFASNICARKLLLQVKLAKRMPFLMLLNM